MKDWPSEEDARKLEDYARLERDLCNLLARIHRDGGHYIAEHGMEKAVEDADARVVQWLGDVGRLEAAEKLAEALLAQRWNLHGHFSEVCSKRDPGPCPDYCIQARAALSAWDAARGEQ